MRRCQLDAALLPPLAITAESLLGPANGSLGLKPSEPVCLQASDCAIAISETKNAGDKRVRLSGTSSRVGDLAIKNAAGSKYMAGGDFELGPVGNGGPGSKRYPFPIYKLT